MRLLLAVAFVAFAMPAVAQQRPQSLDPRTVSQTLNALQAMLVLREAELKAAQEDAQKREKDWAAYSAPLWQLEPQK